MATRPCSPCVSCPSPQSFRWSPSARRSETGSANAASTPGRPRMSQSPSIRRSSWPSSASGSRHVRRRTATRSEPSMTNEPVIDAPGAGSTPAILVVDDNSAKRIALRAMLAPLGHSIVEVDSGRAALQALMQQTFAIILMDVRMPTLNGFETAKLCRQQTRGGRTPIIFVTAIGGQETEAATAYASGAVDFIYTPVLPDVLRAKVSAFVELFLQSQELQRSLESITALNEALRDSDVLAQAVLDNVADGIFILDERTASSSRSTDRSPGCSATARTSLWDIRSGS